MADKLMKEALADQRKRLKVRLWKERAEPARLISPNSGRAYILTRPRCVYCRETIWQSSKCAMHEWLIKRNAIPVSLQSKIMTAENCVLAHYSCHEQYGQTREFKLRCARAQYKRYGREKIVAWVESLGLRQHVEIPDVSDL